MLSTMYLRYKSDTRGLMVWEINRNLLQKGINIDVVAPGDANYKAFEVIDNVKIHRFTYFFQRNLQKLAYGAGIPTNLRKSFLAKLQVPFFALSFLIKTIRIAKKCDLIHAQWIATGFIGLLAKKFVKKKVIVTVRRVAKTGFMNYVNKYVLKNADYVIFNSNYTMRESLKIARPKAYSTIWNPINCKKFRPDIKSNLKRELKLEGKRIIFSMGLLVEKKGFSYLIKAIQEVIKYNKNVVLVIGGHGTEESNLKKLVRKLNLEKHVIFVGKISSDKTPLFYNVADIFVLPSIVDRNGETETLGVVLLEAMACEKPVIASRVGGIPDIITKECGILVKQKDPSQLSKSIIKLLGNSRLRNKMGKKGRKRIESNFIWGKTGSKMLEIYEKMK